jgi:glycosyltransferase involved in cell wall biosynthesis
LRQAGVVVFALGLRSLLDLPRAFGQLFRIIRARNPDIVQTWMYHADFLGGLAAKMGSDCPVVWGVRTTDVPVGGAPATALLRWICARLSHWLPDRIVCAAQASRQSHEAIGYDARKMLVIPNGYDLSRLTASSEERRETRARFGIAEDELVIGSVGRLHADKDPENFVRMAALLASRHARLCFLMVGRGIDDHSESLRRCIAGLGGAGRFILIGERADVPQCLAAMDVFCLHSRNEGFPNVLAEAMAMGLPCVTTDVGDAAMLISDVGIVVPRENPERLAKAIEELMRLSPLERKTLGARAKARIQDRYSIEAIRARFDALYQKLASGAGH